MSRQGEPLLQSGNEHPDHQTTSFSKIIYLSLLLEELHLWREIIKYLDSLDSWASSQGGLLLSLIFSFQISMVNLF